MGRLLKYAIVLALGVAIGAYIVLDDIVPDTAERDAMTAHSEAAPPATPASIEEEELEYASPSGSRRSKDGARSSPLAERRLCAIREGGGCETARRNKRFRRRTREHAGLIAELTMSRAMHFPSGSGRPRPMRNLRRRRSIDPFSPRRLPRPAIPKLPLARRLRRREPRPSPLLLSRLLPVTRFLSRMRRSRMTHLKTRSLRTTPRSLPPPASRWRAQGRNSQRSLRTRSANATRTVSRSFAATPPATSWYASPMNWAAEVAAAGRQPDEEPGAPPAAADVSNCRAFGRKTATRPRVRPRPHAGADVATLTSDETCKRDGDRLVQLRSSPSGEEVQRFANELGCEKLRPQLQRLMESLDFGASAPRAPADRSHSSPLLGQACVSERSALDRLRQEPSAEAAGQFWRDMQCEGLRPQVRLLLESLNVAPEQSGIGRCTPRPRGAWRHVRRADGDRGGIPPPAGGRRRSSIASEPRPTSGTPSASPAR